MLIPLHGIGSRHDLPLPFSFVLAGAGAALLVSFVVLIYAWRRPRFGSGGGRELPRLTAALRRPGVGWAARLLVLALYAWVGLALAGGEDRLTNPVFGFVYVWMWVGLVPVSLLLGPFWRATNPLRTLHRGLCVLARVDPEEGVLTLPVRLGVWPAALGAFGFAWLELVQPDRTTLSVLRLWAAAWLVVLIVGAVVFGSRWIAAADVFEAYATAVSQLSPVHWVDSRLRLINPLAALTSWRAPPGAVGLVAALLGSTAFDSLQNTSWWIQTTQRSAVGPVPWSTAGLATVIVVVLVSFVLAARWMGRYAGRPATAYPRLMAPSLVPIVVGYAVAHYATLLVVEGQRTAINLVDPLGRGWNLARGLNMAGSAATGVDTAIYAFPGLIAVIQLGAIVGGHLLGIVCAHELAVRELPPGRMLAGQWPMVVVMIGYTTAGLVLLFSP